MPRFLWIGLVVCALGLLAALGFVRAIEPGLDVEHGLADAQLESPDAHVDLIAAQDVERGARSPAEASRAAESAEVLAEHRLALERMARRSELRQRPKPPPKFETGVIEVRVVRDHDGQPLLGVSVTLSREGARDVQSTDLGGTVVFTNVHEGRSTLSAMLAGHARGRGEAQIAREVPFANVELRLVAEREVVVRLRDPAGRPFDPEAWHLDRRATGRIGIRLDSHCGRVGSAFEAADVLQYTARSSDLILGAFTWRVRIHPTPEICVHALLDDVIVGVERLDPLASELDVRLDPRTIEKVMAPVLVRVVADADGVPIAGALVEFTGLVGNPQLFQTGIDGCVRVSMSTTPSPEFVVKAPGYASTRVSLTRPYLPESVVRMPTGRRIAGRVVDRDGAPLATALVELRMTAAVDWDAPKVISGPSGAFEFVDVAAGEYEIVGVYVGGPVKQLVECRGRDVLDVELKVRSPEVVPAPSPR